MSRYFDDLQENGLTDWDEENLALLNQLARAFYSRLGYEAPEGYNFSEAIHPMEAACFDNACLALNLIQEFE